MAAATCEHAATGEVDVDVDVDRSFTNPSLCHDFTLSLVLAPFFILFVEFIVLFKI